MFEVKTENTFEAYSEYIRSAIAADRSTQTAAFRRGRVFALTVCFVGCIGFICAYLYFWPITHNPMLLMMTAITAAVLIYGAFRVINYARLYRTPKDEKLLRTMWENDVKTHGAEYTLRFGDESFDLSASEYSACIKYSAVTRLIETETHFYIMTGLNQGFIVSKEGLAHEERLFIRTHCSSEKTPQITV